MNVVTSMSIHVHHVRGRLRLRVPGLKSCPAKAAVLQSALACTRGVIHVDCRNATGSVIVHYQPGAADMEAVLRILGCREPVAIACNTAPLSRLPLKSAAPNRDSQVAAKVLQEAFWLVLQKAAERALLALVAALL